MKISHIEKSPIQDIPRTFEEVNNYIQTSLLGVANANIISEPGRKIKIVACVLRNDGSGWRFIDTGHGDLNHSHINVTSVTADATKIHLQFSFTAVNVLSFVATPDETFAALKYFTGASVGTNYADIQIAQGSTSIGGYISYNGASWDTSLSKGVSSVSFNAGVLTINHDSVADYGVSLSGRGGKYHPQITANSGAMTNTTTAISFYDSAGTVITTPNTDMKFLFTKYNSGGLLNPLSVTSASGNIWCLGVFEV